VLADTMNSDWQGGARVGSGPFGRVPDPPNHLGWYHWCHCCVAPNSPGCSPAARARRLKHHAHAPAAAGSVHTEVRPLIRANPA